MIALATLATPSVASAASEFQLYPTNWVNVAINFVVLLVLIYPVHKWLLGPIAAVLQKREEQTVGAQAQVTDLRGESSELSSRVEADLREARSTAQAARLATLAKAERQERDILERARDDAGRTLAALRASIAGELESARGELETQSAALGREVASKLLGRAL